MRVRPVEVTTALAAFASASERFSRKSPSRALAARLTLAALLAAILSGLAWAQKNSPDCQLIASLPPMATFGGPATVAPGHTELALAFGGYGELLPDPCIHGGGEDWLVRFRRGLGNRFDLGFDTVIDNQTDGSLGITAKAATRFQVTRGLRLEGGVGASDQGDGKAVNGDFAAVIGTNGHPEKIWNYYMSLRLGASRGLCQGSPCAGTQNHLPGALVPLGVLGTTARVSDRARFVMEAGLGGIFAREYSTTAPYLHLSFGVQFDVGKDRK